MNIHTHLTVSCTAVLGITIGLSLLLVGGTAGDQTLWNGEPGVVHREVPWAWRGPMLYRDDGSLIMYGLYNELRASISPDRGRTWGEKFAVKTVDGEEIPKGGQAVLKLQSGRIGLMTGPYGWGVGLFFHTSDDGGITFTEGVPIPGEGLSQMQRNSMIQLSSGRILIPVFALIGRFYPPGHLLRAPFCIDGLCTSYVYYSDDEGQTWEKSGEVVITLPLWTDIPSGYEACEEPFAIELKDGRVMMVLRTRMGRLFQYFSENGGESWTSPEPMELAASSTPADITRIPTTGDLLICWTQISKQEIIDGLNRHRLSVAISTDEGKTWGNFKNLYSLDDYNYVRPDDPYPIVPGRQWFEYFLREKSPEEIQRGDLDLQVPGRGYIGLQENVYMLPEDRSRYYREPVSHRTTYPLVAFTDDEVLISYEMSKTTATIGYEPHNALDIFPIDWLYEPIVPDGPYTRLMLDGEPVPGPDITLEDGTAFGWADVLGKATGVEAKRTRVPVRIFLENYGATIPEGGWHPNEGPRGTIRAQRAK